MPFRFARIGLLLATCTLSWLVLIGPSSAHGASDSPGAFPGTGWNTWDIARPNAMIHMPDGVTMDLSIYDTGTGKLLGRPYLSDVQYFGPHTPDGSYSRARYKQAGLTYEIEFATSGDRLVAHVQPLDQGNYLLVAELSFGFGRQGSVQKRGDRIAVTAAKSQFYVASPNAQVSEPSLSSEHRMLWSLTGDRWITVTSRPESPASEAECRSQINDSRERYEAKRVRSGGILEDSAQAAVDAAAWNMVWNPRHDMPVVTVAREFPAGSGLVWGGYIQGGWDTAFQSLLADVQSEPMAEATIRGLLADTTSDGFVPNAGTGWGVTENRSQPPIASFVALKLYKRHGSRKFLEEIFLTLYRWHQWWHTARDGNHNGLLEWGSHPVDTQSFADFTNKEIEGLVSAYIRLGAQPPTITPADLADNLAIAGMESGLDNSPMWDGVKFNKQTSTMEQDDVGLNSFWALDAWSLAEIAHILGKNAEEQVLRQDFRDMSARINDLMWSEDAGMYLNRGWDGTLSPRISPTNFYPMLAGVASPQRAERMVRQYLLSPQKFWGEYVIPTSPRDDPAFRDQQYWRGRIWAPTNYLVYQGLKRSGMDEVASELAVKSTRLFLGEWKAKGHIHENYNSDSGTGDDVIGSSVKYYAWGGLLPLTMMEELIDVETWGTGLRLGSLSDRNASVNNVQIADDTYDVFLGPGLRVVRNGQPMLESDHPVVLRNFSWGLDHIRFNTTTKAGAQITLHGFRENEKIRFVSPPAKDAVAVNGKIVVTVDSSAKTVDLARGPL